MFSSLPSLFAQLATPQNAEAGRFALQASADKSKEISKAWDYTWEQVLNGPLFEELNRIGLIIAAACLILWTISFAKKWLDSETGGMSFFQELIFPMIVILLLSNGGANMRLLSMGMRSAINGLNSQMLEKVAAKLNIEQITLELADYAAVEGQFGNLRSQCSSIVNQQKLVQCLKLQGEAQQGILDSYREKYGDSVRIKRLEAVKIESAKDPVKAAQQASGGGIFGFDPLVEIVKIVLMAFQIAFAQLIEASLLLTAVMGPIAVGATLLPFGAKPLYAWLTSFFSLGLAKLSYNIISGIVAVSFYKQSGGGDSMGAAIFFGLLAPILALAAAGGGGLAVFNGITSAAANAGQVGIRFIK